MTVTFIGLGIMGAPMARNLLAAGHDVIGINRSHGPVARFIAAGGRAAELADAVAASEVVMLMLPDSPDVERVVLGDDSGADGDGGGVLVAARPGTCIVDLSSIAPATSRRLAEVCATRGIRYLDAPVSGGEQGAIEGTLSIMVGGAADDLAAVRPLLEAIGSTIVHVGDVGAGQTVKAANQLIVAGTIQLVAEALVFLEQHGADVEAAVRVLAGGLAGNRILDRKSAGMIERRFEPGFRIELHRKDLGIYLAAARDAGVVSPAGAVVGQLLESAVANGDGALDHTALLRGVDRMNGREVTPAA
ncbi:2-hydroxy-3-oxopropionate reductase [Agromyces sp. 3263]|uniref:NAD(P)-dependent oxidoreductase n=1 Tax=Agromyces sp. 3263 TaxID=2817750 RepID=UPI0028639152|nr:NAD(P)-binding domain-containing protein [Agromyces sp. 3263]MDR6906381.1 2-hydroxy-3-oxopropionate reductase [Agromyces sp. 3263]